MKAGTPPSFADGLVIMDIIGNSGTEIAFPSQTLYVSKDTGIDRELGEKAEAEVANWRRTGKLPFPKLPLEEIDRLSGTLDYPPRGSFDTSQEFQEENRTTGPLSAPLEDDASSEPHNGRAKLDLLQARLIGAP